MTRTQFLILLYKKLIRPALLMLVAWFAIRFIIELVQGVNSSTFSNEFFSTVAVSIGYLIAIALLYAVLQKAITFVAAKANIYILPNSKTAKAFTRLTDIALGMVILYVWQQNSAYALGLIVAIAYGIITDKYNPK